MLKNEGEKPASRIFSSDSDCLSLVRCACRPRETRRPWRPIPRRLASLVAADAFAEEPTRGSIGTIPATVETENTRSYQGGVLLLKTPKGRETSRAGNMLRLEGIARRLSRSFLHRGCWEWLNSTLHFQVRIRSGQPSPFLILLRIM